MPRLEWRFSTGSVLDDGNWFIDHGDPVRESIVSLQQVIRISDDPVFCLIEHMRIQDRIVAAATELLHDLDAALPAADGAEAGRLASDSPLVSSLLRARRALQHVLLQAVDGLVECRKGRIEEALRAEAPLATEVLFSLAGAQNTLWWLEARLPY